MKVTNLVIAGAVALAAASPHRRHAHRHIANAIDKRAEATVYAAGPVETVYVYELEGHVITEDDVRKGIANGTLSWGDNGVLSSSSIAVAQATPAPQVAPKPAQVDNKPNGNPAPPQEAPKAPEPAPKAPEPAPSKPESPSGYKPVGSDGNCPDCDKEFRNNYHLCNQFPTGYGALRLGHEGLGGWTGIQDPKERGAAGYDNIVTAAKGSCENGDCCKPGMFCSYACPNPYLKNSFPKKQGKTGQSVGGLYCNENGKLEMADGSIGKTLCGRGTTRMKIKVENKLSQSVSICRTDYPGTESETIPFTLQPGESGELASPDQKTYYFWEGKPTSAQYYINKKGVPEKEACTWGTGAKAVGNWAPTNFGTSWDDINMNAGFAGLSQNKPTNPDDRLDFSISFKGDGVQNPCRFKKSTGEYCSGETCGRDVGCTASIKEGATLTMVFSDD
ncbi:glycoside hydrolase family 132 protein [Periconia macrospinosa]|uniref:Glycoside hydrolase family 132 protein n=1 Tax=Periconia macrospinosa TaxID=97972 RepID=A0A2V1D8N0_9PLEO|nr:glycoside hydrolase family 132 protein [Periconia macrospinosa]